MIRASTVSLELARCGIPAGHVSTFSDRSYNEPVTVWRIGRGDALLTLRCGVLPEVCAAPAPATDLPGVQRIAATVRNRIQRELQP